MSIVFVAFFFRGITGFGGALISVPLMGVFLNLKTVLTIEAFLEFFASIILLPFVFRDIKWKILFIMILGATIGTLLGVFLLNFIAELWLKKILGLIIIFFGIYYFFFKPDDNVKIYKRYYLSGTISGFLGGALGGMFGTSGPPFVIYLTSILRNKDQFRSTLIALFAIDYTWRSILYSASGLINQDVIRITSWCMVSLLPATFLGSIVKRKITNKLFLRLVALLILISGLSVFFISY